MRLFDAILNANHRAAEGDRGAGVHPSEFAEELPIVALSCVDPRLNPLLPEVLGVPEDQFIWLRNAGNIITGPLSSTMRSIALACAVKGGKQIVVIGHTDCLVRKTHMLDLVQHFEKLGVKRQALPENLSDFFGLFASEHQNVIRATQIVRGSPLVGPGIPVHGLLVDTVTGKLDWLVNGYNVTVPGGSEPALAEIPGMLASLAQSLPELPTSQWKFPEQRIGELVTKADEWLAALEQVAAPSLQTAAQELAIAPEKPPKIPLPPRAKPKFSIRRNWK